MTDPDEIELELEVLTHSGVSNEKMLDALGGYIDGAGPGLVFADEGEDGTGRWVSSAGVITQVDLEGGKLKATVRLLDPKLSWVALAILILCESGDPPYLSPVLRIEQQGEAARVSSVVVRPSHSIGHVG